MTKKEEEVYLFGRSFDSDFEIADHLDKLLRGDSTKYFNTVEKMMKLKKERLENKNKVSTHNKNKSASTTVSLSEDTDEFNGFDF